MIFQDNLENDTEMKINDYAQDILGNVFPTYSQYLSKEINFIV